MTREQTIDRIVRLYTADHGLTELMHLLDCRVCKMKLWRQVTLAWREQIA